MEENPIPRKPLSRKDFIKNTALTAAAFSIVPRHVLGGKGFTAPSDKLYIAAVGCGGEAENDIHTMQRLLRKMPPLLSCAM